MPIRSSKSKFLNWRIAGDMVSVIPSLRAKYLVRPSNFNCSAFLCIYRYQNQPSVEPLVDQANQLGMKIALWALDRPIPGLSSFTVGNGPGLKIELLNHLWKKLNPHSVHQVVIADDDCVFARGSLNRLQEAADYCDFGVAQPGHHWRSNCSYAFTRSRYVMARQTTFVEPGPMIVVTQPWVKHVIPFPKDFGMGWGLWLLWQDLQKQGCKLGILDCISIKHLKPVAVEYSTILENKRLKDLLQQQNIGKLSDAQRTLRTWQVWQREPSWKS